MRAGRGWQGNIETSPVTMLEWETQAGRRIPKYWKGETEQKGLGDRKKNENFNIKPVYKTIWRAVTMTKKDKWKHFVHVCVRWPTTWLCQLTLSSALPGSWASLYLISSHTLENTGVESKETGISILFVWWVCTEHGFTFIHVMCCHVNHLGAKA